MTTLQTAHHVGTRFFLRAAYAKATAKKYATAVTVFLEWCESEFGRVELVSELDEILTDYFYFLYESGGGRARAVDTLYGIFMFAPAWRSSFPISYMSLKGWSRLVPVVSHPPLSWELTVLLSIQLLREGFPLIALGVLLAFDCLLRISELLGLAPEDVVFPGDCRLGVPIDRAMLRLKVTKTGKNQWVPISKPVVFRWLRAVLIRCQSTARLFPFSSSLFLQLFKATVAKLRLPTSIVPHSLRHGGATRLHLSGLPLEDILLRGRWAASKSAKHFYWT